MRQISRKIGRQPRTLADLYSGGPQGPFGVSPQLSVCAIMGLCLHYSVRAALSR